MNFSLYYLALRGTPALGENKVWGRLKLVFGDPEFRVYLAVLSGATALLFCYLLTRGQYDAAGDDVRNAAFMATTIVTTTGFGTEDYTLWGESAKGLIFLLMFSGGCSGSTAGGREDHPVHAAGEGRAAGGRKGVQAERRPPDEAVRPARR